MPRPKKRTAAALCLGACAVVCAWGQSPFGSTYMPFGPGSDTPNPEKKPALVVEQKPSLSAKQMGALALVRGDRSSGSAFICKWNDRFFVVTNAHVLSGNTAFTVTDVKGGVLTVEDAFVARAFDVALLRIRETPADYLEIMQDAVAEAKIGDTVVVPGNTRGRSVVRQVAGKILGVGPELVEVDAPFEPGNSGSPILHHKTGKVLGLATFTVTHNFSTISETPSPPAPPKEGDTPTPRPRRVRKEVHWFGYRIDTIREWEPIQWGAFFEEGMALADVEARTKALVKLFSHPQGGYTSEDPKIRQAFEYYRRDVRRPGLTDAYCRQRVQGLLRDLRNLAIDDVKRLAPRYAYHAEQLREQREMRAHIVEDFERSNMIMSMSAYR